jgi:hypothetical protein
MEHFLTKTIEKYIEKRTEFFQLFHFQVAEPLVTFRLLLEILILEALSGEKTLCYYVPEQLCSFLKICSMIVT